MYRVSVYDDCNDKVEGVMFDTITEVIAYTMGLRIALAAWSDTYLTVEESKIMDDLSEGKAHLIGTLDGVHIFIYDSEIYYQDPNPEDYVTD